MTPTQLSAFLDDLKIRLASGALAEVGPILLRPFVELDDLEAWARRTLADVERWQAMDAGMRALYYIERRRAAADLELLQRRLAGQLVTDEEIAAAERDREWNCPF